MSDKHTKSPLLFIKLQLHVNVPFVLSYLVSLKIVILYYTEQCTVKYCEMSQGETAEYE
jgi:hypothetical protein